MEYAQVDLDKAIYSGLYATFFYMKHAFPYLKEAKGSVINFASGAGISGKPGQSSYAAAKEGIRGLSRVAANEWACSLPATTRNMLPETLVHRCIRSEANSV